MVLPRMTKKLERRLGLFMRTGQVCAHGATEWLQATCSHNHHTDISAWLLNAWCVAAVRDTAEPMWEWS